MKRMISLCLWVFLLTMTGKAQQIKSVKVGNMVWMAENLNTSTSGSCYYNYNSELGKKYGSLYTWEAAKSACPAGWHLPNDAEWNKLIELAGGFDVAGKLLKLGGTLGFNATYGGFTTLGNFILLDSYGAYWSSSSYDKDHAWYIYITRKDNLVTRTYFTKRYGLSVRCVKD